MANKFPGDGGPQSLVRPAALHLEQIARAPERQAFDRLRDLRLKRQKITGVGQVVVGSKTFE